MTANYFGEIAFIDHGVGRILGRLDELGLAANTLAVFTADHGELLGDHGLYLKGPTPYEGLLKVGLIVQGPGVEAGRDVPDPVSTVDLAATFYDYAGIDCPEDIQSRSLKPVMQGGEGRDVAYSEWNLHPSRAGVELQLRTVRTAEAKLTVDLLSGVGEMYDLANDPDEMDNLFDDAGHRGLRRELTDMIRARPGTVLSEFPEHRE